MLNCAHLLLQILPKLASLIAQIAEHDRDLAKQLRTATGSIALNLAEGNASSRGNRRARLESSYASLKETIMGLQVGLAFGYIASPDPALLDALDHIAASTWRLMHPRH